MKVSKRFSLIVFAFVFCLSGCATTGTVTINSGSDRVTMEVPRYEGGEQQACVQLDLLARDIIHGVQLQLPCDYEPFVAASWNNKPLAEVQWFRNQDGVGTLCFPVKIPPFVATERNFRGSIIVYILENYAVVAAAKDHPVALLARKKIPLSVVTSTDIDKLPDKKKIDMKYRPTAMNTYRYSEIYRSIHPLPSKVKKRLRNDIDHWLTYHQVTGGDRLRLEAIRNIIAREKQE